MANHTRYGNGEKRKGKCEGAGYGMNGQASGRESCQRFQPRRLRGISSRMVYPPAESKRFQRHPSAIYLQATCKNSIAFHYLLSVLSELILMLNGLHKLIGYAIRMPCASLISTGQHDSGQVAA
jgi:hypothetical protein